MLEEIVHKKKPATCKIKVFVFFIFYFAVVLFATIYSSMMKFLINHFYSKSFIPYTDVSLEETLGSPSVFVRPGL